MTHHDMIQHPNIHQAQGFLEPLGNASIGVAGFGITAGVIVDKYHRRCVVFNGVLDHFTRVDTRGINRAPKQLIKGD